MRIVKINGSDATPDPLVFGQFEKVEMILRTEVSVFDTFGFTGYIDYCDSTQTQLITERTTHSFSYPEGYQKVLDPSWLVPDEDLPPEEPTDPDAPPLTPEEEEAKKEAARIERARKKAEAEVALAQENRHRVILYFSAMQDYGVISNEFLSQVDILQTAFPTFVGLGDDGSGRLVIANPNFTAPNGVTKNTKTHLQFLIRTYDASGNPSTEESTFKVLPKIFESLKDVTTFERYEVELPTSVEKVEYQGDFEAIEYNFGMDFVYHYLYEGPRKVTIANALTAMPRGGKPIFMYRCYSTGVETGGYRTINLEELPDTRTFYSVERLKFIGYSWYLPLLLTNTKADKEDPLPLGPDYSQSKVLKVVSLPPVDQVIGEQGHFFGQKLYNWPIADGVEIVHNTHIAPFDTIEAINIVGTYGEYCALANVKPRLDKDKNPVFPPTEQMIADQLPSSIREVYGYFEGLNMINNDGTNFKFPRLPEGAIAVRGYFTLDCVERGSDGLVIPGLPSTIRFIDGYCMNMINSITGAQVDPATLATHVPLHDIADLELEENLCNNVESVKNWMTNSYGGSNVNLTHRTDKLIRPVPTLSPTGKTLNSFENAFTILSTIVHRVVPGDQRNDGSDVIWDYVFYENRWLSIDSLLPYLSDLSDSTVHVNAYHEAFNGNYHGAIEDLAALTSLAVPQIITVNDGSESHDNWIGTNPPLTDEEVVALRDVGSRGDRLLTLAGQTINGSYMPS